MKIQLTKHENNISFLKKDKAHHLSLQERKYLSIMEELKSENEATETYLNKKIEV